MLSVRVTAAGAVFVCCVSFLTAPARACDDRYLGKCEKAAAAQASAGDAAPAGKRSARRVRTEASRQARHARLRHRQAPRFATRLVHQVTADGSANRPDTPMARRFRGFIDPQPLAHNSFEALRKPHLVSLDFGGNAILPVVDVATAAVAAPEAASAAPVTAPAKQDRLAAPPATMELASAESRPVTLPPAPKAAVDQTATVVATAAPAPSEPQNSKFAFHGLVLALCGALGAASALRFIVRA